MPKDHPRRVDSKRWSLDNQRRLHKDRRTTRKHKEQGHKTADSDVQIRLRLTDVHSTLFPVIIPRTATGMGYKGSEAETEASDVKGAERL
jgi:hypothetical protein